MVTKGEEWKTRAARWSCFAIGALGVYLFLRYALMALLPFLLAWGVAVLVYPLSVRTAKKIHLPQKLVAVVYVILLLTMLGLLLFWGTSRLLREIESLLLRLSEEKEGLSATIDNLWARLIALLRRIPFLSRMDEGEVGAAVADMLRQALAFLGEGAGRVLGAFFAVAPNLLFGIVVTLLACFYLSADYEGIRDRLIGLLPSGAQQRTEAFRRRAKHVLAGYGRAYLILFGLTFFEVFVGLLILKIPYAFLIALAVAGVDILPLLGAGAVLIPWAILLFVGGNAQTALWILVLYGVLCIVRQIAESHLLGTSLGVHPLLSLFCVFVGWQLFGFFGMLLGPAVALALQELCRREEIS